MRGQFSFHVSPVWIGNVIYTNEQLGRFVQLFSNMFSFTANLVVMLKSHRNFEKLAHMGHGLNYNYTRPQRFLNQLEHFIDETVGII